jgi:branched-chain amino acid transport system substrate-binding protein
MRSRLLIRSFGVWLSVIALVMSACSTPTTPSQPAQPPAANPTPAGASGAGAAQPTSAPAAAQKPTGSPIKLGVLDDVTGIGAIEGALMRISVELAVSEVNNGGGINGHPLEVTYADPKGDATQALQLATQLAQQDNVDVLAGGIFSPECLGVQGLAEKLQMVYVAVNGCATDQFSAKSCSKYSFRVYPAGRQTSDPAFSYEVKNFGTKWAIIYPDYALGQSQLATSEAALQKNGAEYVTKVAVPLGETNVTPFVTKVPTDGSVTALYITMTGSDLARVMNVVQQFGMNKKMAIVTGLGKESFAGVYPEALDGAIITGTRSSDGIPGNKADEDYQKAWLEVAKKNADLTGPLGGVDKVTPGNNNGYNAYMSIKALTIAMRKSGFTGKADTEKLVSAMETLNVPQGPGLDAFPSGQMIMNKDDHQGRTTYYLLKINGQKEEVVQTFAADSLPLIGDCKIQ